MHVRTSDEEFPRFNVLQHARGIGYLSPDRDFLRGEVSDECFDRLIELVRNAPIHWFGYHDCELDPCGSGQPPAELRDRGMLIPTRCSTDILVPGAEVLYVAPALILHYIRFHRFLPPADFLEAVMNCPDPKSQEYVNAVNRPYPTAR